MKETLAIVLLALMFSLVGCSWANNVSDDVTVGVVMGLSGSHAYYGVEALRGMQMALEEIDDDVSLIIEDSRADPHLAVKATNKLLSADDVDFLITFSGASAAQAILPITNSQEIVQIELICYAPGCHTKDDFLFRVSGNAYDEPYFVAEDLIALGLEESSVIYVQNALGQSMLKFFEEKYTSLGGQISSSEGFAQGTTDFKSILTKVSHVDAIVVFSYAEVGYLLKDARELGLDITVYGIQTMRDPQIKKIAGEQDRVFHSYPATESGEFDKLYEQRYGFKPSIFALKGYDAMMVLYQGIEECGGNSLCVKETLEEISYEGVSNYIDFDEYGDLSGETYKRVIYEVG